MSNNSNPHDLDGNQVRNKGHTSGDVARSTVLDVIPDSHAVRINQRGDNAPFIAPVLTPMYGSHMLPNEGERVTVLYIAENVPVVLGSIYLADGQSPPDVDAGDFRIGNESGASITLKSSGDVMVESGDDGDVYIDGVQQ